MAREIKRKQQICWASNCTFSCIIVEWDSDNFPVQVVNYTDLKRLKMKQSEKSSLREKIRIYKSGLFGAQAKEFNRVFDDEIKSKN